jgi:hypothetical protein
MQVLKSTANLKLLVSGRGAGKTFLITTAAINACCSHQPSLNSPSSLEALIVSPTLKMARNAFWKPLLNLLEGSLYVTKIDRSNLQITFTNKVILTIDSAEGNGERIRGKNLIWCAIDEAQDVSPTMLDEVIIPCFRSVSTPVNVLIAGTPKGRAHPFYKLYQRVLATPNWKYFHFKSSDRPTYPRAILKQAKASLPARIYAQEYLAEWTSAPGQFFDCFEERHIISPSQLPNHYDSIWFGNDNGSTNPAICVIGVAGNNHYIIDAWSNPHPLTSVTVDEIIKQLHSFLNDYQAQADAVHIRFPDDRNDLVLSARSYGNAHNLIPFRKTASIARNNPGPIGRASIVNTLFFQDRLFILSSLSDQIEELRSYHRDKNSQGEHIDKVAPNQKDHFCDSTLYVLAALNKNNLIK